jgi:uncharacterized protein
MAEDDKAELFARIATFEWDEDKRERNLRDHKIDFEDARQIIDGPTFVRRSDREGEARYVVFGFVDGDETVVVCTFRGKNCRLISARRARRDERKKYYGGLSRQSAARED